MRAFAGDAVFRRLARGSGLMMASNLGGAALSLAAAALAGRAVGGERYGIYTFCMAWSAGLVTLCEAGLDGALEREVARNPAASADLGRTGLLAKLPLIALACGGAALCAPWLAAGEAVGGLRLGAAQAAAFALMGIFSAVFRGNGSYAPVVSAGLAAGVLQAAGTAAIVSAGGSVTDLLALAAVLAGLQCLWLGLAGLAQFGLPAGPPPIVPAQLYRLAAPFLAGVAVRVAQGRVAPLMLGYLSPPVELGFFGAASRLADAARLLPNGLLQGTYSLFATGGADRRRAFSSYAIATALMAILGGAAMLGLGPTFARLVFGPLFEGSGPVTQMLGLALACGVVADAAITYLFAAGDERFAIRWNGVAVAIQAGVTVAVVGEHGASGAAFALALSRAITCVPLGWQAWRGARRRFWADDTP
ncbi:MAG: oligosaccharide flippase family protein [Thermoflexales bacterium]